MIYILLLLGDFLMCQENKNINSNIPDIQPSKRTYITDELGNLFINVNVWGTRNSGIHALPEGSTIVDVLSATGGIEIGYDYKNITLLREDNQNQKFKIDISEFLKTGDRKGLIKILPNDIIIIKQKPFYKILESFDKFSTILNVLILTINLARF